MTNRVVLLTPLSGTDLQRIVDIFAPFAEVVAVADLAGIRSAKLDRDTTLIAFGTGVIVPSEILDRLHKPAYNFHAASPDFPGRDPHHYAVYAGSKTFGATVHLLTARVDSGPIVAVDEFSVPPGSAPVDLLALANSHAFHLLKTLGPRLLATEPLPPVAGLEWGSRKTTRKDFHRACRVTVLTDEPEFQRRFHAFDGGAYDNLTTVLHGRTWRIDKSIPQPQRDRDGWSEFTEAGFRSLLRGLLARGYGFARFGELRNDRHVIWRHDVDFSMNRAARLAEIEKEEGAFGTYFINPRSAFYSVLEPSTLRLVQSIRAAGHEIGLHFDAGAYSGGEWRQQDLAVAVRRERSLVEEIIEAPLRAVSWHNPTYTNLLSFEEVEVAGLVNAYSAALRRDYVYGSDSNGYWRFEPMRQVIAAGHPRLYLLTHPEWWTPEPMPPSERVDRALLGRARAARRDYDGQLAFGGRRNVDR